MELNFKNIEKELEIIFQSSQFITSDKEKKLLDYLVQKTLSKEFVKEAHIAFDVFKKEDNFDPSLDSTVRVYMGKVRKKLENFYLSGESDSASIKIVIPKGTYRVEFEKRKTKNRVSRLKLLNSLLIVLILIMSASFLIHLLGDSNDLYTDTKEVANHPVWKEYRNSSLPTMIVVGDFFFMSKEIDEKRFFVRNAEINSIEDFLENKLDSAGFEAYRHTYSPSEITECVSYLIPHLKNNRELFKIKRASLLTWEDVNSNNIIFVGDFKTLNILNRLLPRFNLRYDIEERSYFLLDENKEEINRFEFIRDPAGYRSENIVVAKRSGGNNNTITLILALGRGGLDDVTKILCDSEFLRDFKKEYIKGSDKKPFFFDMVFSVEGIEGTSLDYKIVYFNQVHP